MLLLASISQRCIASASRVGLFNSQACCSPSGRSALPHRLLTYYTTFSRQKLAQGSVRCKFSKPVFNFRPALHRWSSNAAETALKAPLKKQVKKSELMKLFALASPEKWRLAGAILLLFISSGVTMAVPFALGKIIDMISNASQHGKLADTLNSFCKVLAVIFVCGALANFGRIYFIQTAGQRVVKRLREKIFSSIISQEMAFFDKNKTGELVNRLSNDTSVVSYSVTQNISDGMRSVVHAVGGVTMMFYTSTKLAMVGLAIVPIMGAVILPFGKYMRSVSKQLTDSLAGATQVAEERLSNIRTVRAFAQEEREIELYRKQVDDVLRLSYKEAMVRAAFFGMTGLVGNALVVAVLYTGGVLITDQLITMGQLSSFLLYVVFVGTAVNGLSDFYSELMRGIGASTRMWELAQKTPTIPLRAGIVPSQGLVGRIEFGGVTFAYPSRPDVPVFKDMSLTVAPGEVTAVVGPSGSGKSTLASLLLRFYDIDKGFVKIDDMDVTTISPLWLRKHIGIVSQEPVLFSSSIRDNILYGALEPEKVTDEDVENAARQANCLSFISNFTDGIETNVGERGAMLSGGQKQRIAIARAILKNPKILILDEATSALDSESEYLVQDALEQLMVGRTVLIIAHRLSTIRNADRVVVLAGGSVAETGGYDELMNLPEGKFRSMVEKQTFAYEE